jgi:hypothetical protein
MKKILIIFMIMVMGMVLADTAMAGRVRNRQVNQQKRIHQGIASGELTAWETKRLEKEQWQIQQSKKQVLADGVVTPRERTRLEVRQDKASGHIYRLKHNNHTR